MTDPTQHQTQVFLSVAESAEYLSLSVQGFLKRQPPEPDARIGKTRGWVPATLDAWEATIGTGGQYSKPRGPEAAKVARERRAKTAR